jgi:hypothetical protein
MNGLEPDSVDLFKYLRFKRWQEGGECWACSQHAVWDIMNEMASPFSPNLSMRHQVGLLVLRALLEPEGGLFSPDGRFHTEKDFFLTFGNPTEGTEPFLSAYPFQLGTDLGWSVEGLNEANNYLRKSEMRGVEISSQNFIKLLNSGKPIVLGISAPTWGHSIALIGYHKKSRTFKILNSWGEDWGNNGFGTFKFEEIDEKKGLFDGTEVEIDSAEIFDIYPPKPVPAARISISHTNRSNVLLWLSVEDSPLRRNSIWSRTWDEHIQNIDFTVRLPSEFIWPPSQNNRLILDLYDTAKFSDTGGKLTEFVVAFGGHIVECSELSDGPIEFKARQHLTFHIP